MDRDRFYSPFNQKTQVEIEKIRKTYILRQKKNDGITEPTMNSNRQSQRSVVLSTDRSLFPRQINLSAPKIETYKPKTFNLRDDVFFSMASPISSDFVMHSVVNSLCKMPVQGRKSEQIINVNTFNFKHDFSKQYDRKTPVQSEVKVVDETLRHANAASRSGIRSRQVKN